MSAENIVISVLLANAPLGVLVGDRVYPGELPQGCALPAVVVDHVVTVPVSRIDASAPFTLVNTRIDMTVLAKDYPGQKALLRKVRAAINYQRGVIAGFTVVSIVRQSEGPDGRNTDLGTYSQTLDCMVTWYEPNP